MFEVLITDSIQPPPDIEQRILDGIANVRCLQVSNQESLDESVSNADALIVYHEYRVTSNTIAKMPKCKVIVRGGVGYDNVDAVTAASRKIPVCNIPDYGVDEVADHAIGLMLALHRGIVRTERRLRDSLHPWDRRAIEPIQRLDGMTMGIIGCGRIGSATARRAQAFKMRVMVYDPYMVPGMEKVHSVTRVDLATLLSQSHVISLHTPLTDETRHLIDARALRQMRSDSLLINTARGAVVDTDAVAEALQSGRLGGAAIDVLTKEPPTNENQIVRLWQDRSADVNLILTPHVAYYSMQAIHEIRVKGAEEVRRVLCGERPWNCINRAWKGD